MSETKICKYCKTDIPKDAKICPNCRKKQKGKLGIIIAVVVVLLIIGVAAGGGSDDNSSKIDNSNATSVTSNTNTETSSNSVEDVQESSSNVVQVGGSFENDGLKFTVNSAELDYNFEDKYGFYELDDGLVYLLVDFTFENNGNSDKYISIYDFDCYADNTDCEQKYVTDVTGDFINANLSSGRNKSFKTLYAVPADASSIELEYEPSFWSDEKIIIQIK